MEKIFKLYNSYNEFITDNIGETDVVIELRNSGRYHLDGITKEALEEEFKELIYHNFLDHDFMYNHLDNETNKKLYKEIVNNYYEKLKTSNETFSEFWKCFMRKSGRYNNLYTIQNNNYDEKGMHITPCKLQKHYPDYIFFNFDVPTQLKEEYNKFKIEDFGIDLTESIKVW